MTTPNANRFTTDTRSVGLGASLEVDGQSWRLMVLTRSFGTGLFCLGVSLIPGWLAGYFLLSFLRSGSVQFLVATLMPGAMLFFFGRVALQRLLGKIVVSCDGNQGTIFTGIGIIGQRQAFDWSGMERIEDEVLVPANGRGEIVLNGVTKIRFGHLLRPEQRQVVVQEFCQLLKTAKQPVEKRSSADVPQPTLRSMTLNVSEQDWRLKVSQRSIVEGLLCFVVAMILVVGVVCFAFNALASIGKAPRVMWGGLAVALMMLFMLVPVTCYAAYCLFGKVIITVEGNQGTVFVGVGNVGRRQRFDWSQVTAIDDRHVVLPKFNFFEIVLSGPSQVRFGKRLSESQRIEVLRLLRSLLKQERRQQLPQMTVI